MQLKSLVLNALDTALTNGAVRLEVPYYFTIWSQVGPNQYVALRHEQEYGGWGHLTYLLTISESDRGAQLQAEALRPPADWDGAPAHASNYALRLDKMAAALRGRENIRELAVEAVDSAMYAGLLGKPSVAKIDKSGPYWFSNQEPLRAMSSQILRLRNEGTYAEYRHLFVELLVALAHQPARESK